MARTTKGVKGPGYEYWGKRPGPREPGKLTKKLTHRIERRRAAVDTRTELEKFFSSPPFADKPEPEDRIDTVITWNVIT